MFYLYGIEAHQQKNQAHRIYSVMINSKAKFTTRVLRKFVIKCFRKKTDDNYPNNKEEKGNLC